ncbi:EAL domain-containing protein [Cupriavidus sp. 30B13]|uniref:EAL domain-containing protein n=1 Tax=Cupriavidus sp. 30B13 TaxID=3384241 RepID=UPI003B8EE418
MHPDAGGVGRPEAAPFETGDFAALLAARRQQSGAAPRFAVLAIHLDRFTHASETLGPGPARGMRAQAAARVAAQARTADLAWFGSADLGAVVALPPAADARDAALRVARGVAGALARPLQQDGFELFLSCSIGVALDDPGKPAERTLHEACDAMLRVRKRGGDGIAGAAGEAPAPLSSPVLAALPHALARGQLALNLQPRAMLASGDVAGYTVRLRWQSPEFGRVAPHDFLPALEALGLIGEVAGWMMETALPLLASPGIAEPFDLSFLVSSTQLHGTPLIDTLLRTLDSQRLDPARVCLEIPAAAVPDGDAVAAGKLATLRGAGVRIALSDFAGEPGGHALRATLERLRPDLATFSARCLGGAGGPGRQDAAVAHMLAACELAGQLGVPVCAKGIETRAQLAEVRRWGCGSVQGYLLAQPFPAHWLAQTHAAICARVRELLAQA